MIYALEIVVDPLCLVDTDTSEYNPTEEIPGHHYVFASYNFDQHQMTIIEFVGK